MPKGRTKPNKNIGRIIRKEREHMRMTREEFADKIGCSPGTIAAYENGTRGIGQSVFERLMDIFECDEKYLLGRSPYKTETARNLAARAKLSDEYSLVAEFIQKYIERAYQAEYAGCLYYVSEERDGRNENKFIVGAYLPYYLSQQIEPSADEIHCRISYDVYDSASGQLFINAEDYKKAVIRLADFLKMTMRELLEYTSITAPDFAFSNDDMTLQEYLKNIWETAKGNDTCSGSGGVDRAGGGLDPDQEGGENEY